MSRVAILSVSASGWILAAVLAFRLFVQTAGAEDTAAHSEPPTAPSAAVQSPRLENSPALMEVYVRPHPPDFKSGRWVRFHSYRTFQHDGIERVQFQGAESVTVNSEAIEWPRQRRAYQ